MADKTIETQEQRVRAAAEEMGGTVNFITLSRPFDIGGAQLTELYLREPVAKDFDVWNLGEMESSGGEMQLMRQLACSLAHVAPDALDYLPGIDYMKLTEELQPFLDIAR